jgi:hypothetical protein
MRKMSVLRNMHLIWLALQYFTLPLIGSPLLILLHSPAIQGSCDRPHKGGLLVAGWWGKRKRNDMSSTSSLHRPAMVGSLEKRLLNWHRRVFFALFGEDPDSSASHALKYSRIFVSVSSLFLRGFSARTCTGMWLLAGTTPSIHGLAQTLCMIDTHQ